jgi:hypothetical protein
MKSCNTLQDAKEETTAMYTGMWFALHPPPPAKQNMQISSRQTDLTCTTTLLINAHHALQSNLVVDAFYYLWICYIQQHQYMAHQLQFLYSVITIEFCIYLL